MLWWSLKELRNRSRAESEMIPSARSLSDIFIPAQMSIGMPLMEMFIEHA